MRLARNLGPFLIVTTITYLVWQVFCYAPPRGFPNLSVLFAVPGVFAVVTAITGTVLWLIERRYKP